MKNFILYVNLFDSIIFWFIFIPLFIIGEMTTKIKPIIIAKIGLITTSCLLVLDFIVLSVSVFAHYPVYWTNWITPIFWAIMIIVYHIYYIKVKEFNKKFDNL